MSSSLLASLYSEVYLYNIPILVGDFYGPLVANSWAPGPIEPQVGTLRCGAILKLLLAFKTWLTRRMRNFALHSAIPGLAKYRAGFRLVDNSWLPCAAHATDQ